MSNLNLKPIHLKILTDIFKSYCPQAEIWAYGSRLGGDSHAGSDLDLIVKSFNSKLPALYELKELIKKSNIPFLVDINEFDDLPESFKEEILKNYTVIYNGYSA